MEQIQITISSSESKSEARALYSAPVLKTYGSVGLLTLGPAGTTCDGGNSGSTSPKSGGPPAICVSDPSAKTNIRRIGTHPMGFGLYLFDYKPEFSEVWGNARQFGVMADEIELVMPEAVVRHVDGYKMVNYDMLGICRTVH